MKTEFVDVNETRKNLRVEIPSDVVDAEIDRIARDYSRKARVPASGPARRRRASSSSGSRIRSCTTSAHELIPRAVDEALREKGVEPVDTPDIRDVDRRRRAAADVHRDVRHACRRSSRATTRRSRCSAPSTRSRRRRRSTQALQRLRERARPLRAGRGARRRARRHGRRSICERHARRPPRAPTPEHADEPTASGRHGRARRQGEPARLRRAAARPRAGRDEDVHVHYPADYAITELAGTDVDVHRDGEGDRSAHRCRSWTTSSRRIWASSTRSRRCARACARTSSTKRSTRPSARCARELMKQLATRVPFEVPASLLEREIDRRLEEFVRRLIDQQIDPRKADIDWEEFRESQREAARGGGARRAGAGRGGAARADRRVSRRGDRAPRSRGTRSGPAGRRRRCGRGWRRRGAVARLTRGCGGRRRLTSCCRVLQS